MRRGQETRRRDDRDVGDLAFVERLFHLREPKAFACLREVALVLVDVHF